MIYSFFDIVSIVFNKDVFLIKKLFFLITVIHKVDTYRNIAITFIHFNFKGANMVIYLKNLISVKKSGFEIFTQLFHRKKLKNINLPIHENN